MALVKGTGLSIVASLITNGIRNFSTFGHTPKIRFRYAEEKAKKFGEQLAVTKEKSRPSQSRENIMSDQVQKGRTTTRLERAPKRMSVSKEEMDIVQLGGARP